MYHRYCLPLNKTSLLILHPDEGSPLIVQVTAKHAGESVIDELTEFYLAHHEITHAIENLIYAHIRTPLPENVEVEVEGAGFLLRGTRKSWSFGKTIEIKWGDEVIKPAEDKWTFVIRTLRSGRS